MSVIHINQISGKIKNLFENLIDISDIKDKDENKIVTRCLAAYAVYISTECTKEEAAKSVVDGGDDNGIDAIFYSQIKNKMILVQSKWSNDGSGEPKSEGVSKFCTGVKDLFNLKLERFNTKIIAKEREIIESIEAYETKFELIFIDTHQTNNLAAHSMRHINDLLEEMNNIGEGETAEILKFKRFNQFKVFQSLAKSSNEEPIDLEIGLSQWGKINEPYLAYYGMVSGEEIASWWEINQTNLFEKNIRQVLGSTDVNEEIKNTLKEDSNLFWYYNNGITITCETAIKSAVGGSTKDFGTFKLTDVAIVNGAQTVSTIGKYFAEEEQSHPTDVKVHVRIIALKDTNKDFGSEVTRTNNRQNKIENRDFVTQDKEQLRLRTELLLEDINYSIMRTDIHHKDDKSFGLIEATVALACAKDKTSLTVQAKRGIGKFYDNLEKGIYKELFNQSVNGIYVFNCVKVTRVIDEYLNELIKDLPRRSGKDYGLLVHGNRIITQLTFRFLSIKDALQTTSFLIEENNIKTKVDDVIKKVSQELENKYSENVLGTLFKNSTKCTDITDSITK